MKVRDFINSIVCEVADMEELFEYMYPSLLKQKNI